ncbi:MAG: hypothetical protein K2I96_23440 [Lachnospiraceae bacterium]|nr:hypothetical protein [Lachnospiraceae bacterium]
MVRVGNRTMDVYMSGELKPRSRGSVQSSTDSSDKTVRENRDTVQIHDLHAVDIISNMGHEKKLSNMISKSTHCSIEYLNSYYYRELQREVADYIDNVEYSQGYYGFEDSMASTMHAYSVLHQQIVQGYRDGTRELYVYDNKATDGIRLLTQEEELENLNRAYEELIEWDVGCAKGRYNPKGFNERLNNKELDDLYHTYDVNQAVISENPIRSSGHAIWQNMRKAEGKSI